MCGGKRLLCHCAGTHRVVLCLCAATANANGAGALPLVWAGNVTTAPLSGKNVSLRIAWRDATVYALTTAAPLVR